MFVHLRQVKRMCAAGGHYKRITSVNEYASNAGVHTGRCNS